MEININSRIKLFIMLSIFLLLIDYLYSETGSIPDSRHLKSASGITDEDYKKADSSAELTLFNAFAKAVYNTEKIKIDSELYSQAKARKDQAFGAFLPYVSLQSVYILPKSIKSTAPAGNNNASTGISVYARQNIFTGLNEWENYKAAESDLNYSRIQMIYNSNILLLEVSSGFYNILSLDNTLNNNREILNLYYRMMDELKKRVAIGRSRSSELLRIDTQVYQLEAQIEEIENQLESARLGFSVLIGNNAVNVFLDNHVLSDMPDINLHVDPLVAGRADVKAAKEALEHADIRLTAALGGHLPSVYLQGTYSLLHRGSGSNYYAGIGVELPIFAGGITIAKVKEAESQKRQAELMLSTVTRYAHEDIINSFKMYESSRAETVAFLKALTAAQDNYQSVLDDYRKDRVTILDVLTSLTLLQSTKNDYKKAEFRNRFNRIQLGVAVSEFNGDKIHLLNNINDGSTKQ